MASLDNVTGLVLSSGVVEGVVSGPLSLITAMVDRLVVSSVIGPVRGTTLVESVAGGTGPFPLTANNLALNLASISNVCVPCVCMCVCVYVCEEEDKSHKYSSPCPDLRVDQHTQTNSWNIAPYYLQETTHVIGSPP